MLSLEGSISAIWFVLRKFTYTRRVTESYWGIPVSLSKRRVWMISSLSTCGEMKSFRSNAPANFVAFGYSPSRISCYASALPVIDCEVRLVGQSRVECRIKPRLRTPSSELKIVLQRKGRVRVFAGNCRLKRAVCLLHLDG